MKRKQMLFLLILWGTLKSYAPEPINDFESQPHYWTNDMHSTFVIRPDDQLSRKIANIQTQ